MEILNIVLNRLPFPVVLGLAVIIFGAWLIKEYVGLRTYGQVFRKNTFQILCAFVVLAITIYYSYQSVTYPSHSRETTRISAIEANSPAIFSHKSDRLLISVEDMKGEAMAGSPEGYVTHAIGTRLELQIGGFLDEYNTARFSIVSSGRGAYAIQRLYVKLHGYAESSLRDEKSMIGAYTGTSAYHIGISSKYSEYDLVPLRPPGETGSWLYRGEDSDEFLVDFVCSPYTLYLVSIEMEARDLKKNKFLKFSSPLYKLITVRNGNYGGALDIERWYKPNMLRYPIAGRYRENIPTVHYQLLITNLIEDSAYLSEVGKIKLKDLLPELKDIVAKRDGNPVFAHNLRKIREFLAEKD